MHDTLCIQNTTKDDYNYNHQGRYGLTNTHTLSCTRKVTQVDGLVIIDIEEVYTISMHCIFKRNKSKYFCEETRVKTVVYSNTNHLKRFFNINIKRLARLIVQLLFSNTAIRISL